MRRALGEMARMAAAVLDGAVGMFLLWAGWRGYGSGLEAVPWIGAAGALAARREKALWWQLAALAVVLAQIARAPVEETLGPAMLEVLARVVLAAGGVVLLGLARYWGALHGPPRLDPAALEIARRGPPPDAVEIGGGGTEARIWRASLADREVVIKRYPPARGARAWKDLIRPAAPARAAEAALALAEAGLPTALPLAFHVDRPWPMPRGGTLVMEAAPGLDAAAFLAENGGAVRPRRALAQAMGELVADLHAGWLVHGDLAPGNVVVSRSGGSVWLVDCDGVRLHQFPTARRIQNDLAKLQARFLATRSTRGDRVRFLRAYLAGRGGDPGSWRELWADLAPSVNDRLRAWGWDQRGRPGTGALSS